MIEFEEENLFIFLGAIDTGASYNSALGIMEQLFFLEPETRNIMLQSWIDLLEGCMHEDFLEELSEEVQPGEMAVIISDAVVETRPIPDNILEFKKDDE